MRLTSALFATLLASCGASCGAQELRNWFDDPFVQLTVEVPDCPTPAGPFVDEQDRLVQSHRRAEKGTTAWLAGESERPKAYAYDAEIAASLTRTFRATRYFPDSSLWATVQGRVVYIEGCLAHESEVQPLEALVRSTPFVQQAIAIVRIGRAGPVPFRVMPSQAASASSR
jgi:hypothetical protein